MPDAEPEDDRKVCADTNHCLADLAGILEYDGPARSIEEMNDAIGAGFASGTAREDEL